MLLGQADPYLWPFDGQLRTDNTALLSINFQTNILDPDGDFAKSDMQEQNSHGKHFSEHRQYTMGICQQKQFTPRQHMDHATWPLHSQLHV